jgi:hypothetical protein
MIGNGGTLSQGSILCYACQMPAKVAVSSIRSFWGQSLENKPSGIFFHSIISYLIHFFIN